MFIRLFNVVIAILLSVVLLECLLRGFNLGSLSWSEPDDNVGFVFTKSAYYYYDEEGFSEGHINSHGLRDYEYEYMKPHRTVRILVYGNSFSEAFQVPLDSAFHKILERSLNARARDSITYQVINFGRSGASTTDEYLLLASEGMKYSPDLVIVAFEPHDIENNSFELAGEKIRPFFRLGQNDSLHLDLRFRESRAFRLKRLLNNAKQHSAFLSLLFSQYNKLKAGRGGNQLPDVAIFNSDSVQAAILQEKFQSQSYQRAMEITQGVLLKMNTLVRSNGGNLALIVLPTSSSVRKGWKARLRQFGNNPDKSTQSIVAFCQSKEIPAMDLSSALEDYNARTGKYLHGFINNVVGDGHLNENGHRETARLILSFLDGERVFRDTLQEYQAIGCPFIGLPMEGNQSLLYCP